MKDFEIIKLSTTDEFHCFFNEQEKKDRWINVYTNELFTTPLENNALALYTPAHSQLNYLMEYKLKALQMMSQMTKFSRL